MCYSHASQPCPFTLTHQGQHSSQGHLLELLLLELSFFFPSSSLLLELELLLLDEDEPLASSPHSVT